MTTPVLLAVLAGLMAGLVHALSGPDHLSAVAPLTLQERRGAWRPGLLWGAGHSLGVWGVGALALLLRDVFPLERVSSWSERLVGATLIAVGLWGLRKAFLFRLPNAEVVEHHHTHEIRSDRPGWAAFGVGTLHGLAGSAHILGLFPALALASRAESVGYVVAFGLGTVVAMVAFSSTLGLFASRVTGLGRFGRPAYQALLAASSVVAIAVGGYWLTL